MKKLLLLFCSVILLTSTGCDNFKLTAGKAKRIIANELSDKNLDCQIRDITTGYYEENDEDTRYQLRQLAAAGVIEYQAERIMATRNAQAGYDWWSGRNIYRAVTEPHYFINVQLTPAGKKFLTVKPENAIDKDLESAISDEIYPEDSVSREEYFPGDAIPEKPQTEASETVEASSTTDTEEVATVSKTEYDIALEKVSETSEAVIEYRIKIVKARNIAVLPNLQTASCEAIFESVDVSPFGRVFSHARDGERKSTRIGFSYLQDKGWTISELN